MKEEEENEEEEEEEEETLCEPNWQREISRRENF